MSRDLRLYLEDIVASIIKIQRYINGFDFNEFVNNDLVYDAAIRNLEIIGEASKNLTQEIKERYPATNWRQMAALRNVLAHAYHGIDNEIIWDIVINELEPLKEQVKSMLQDML